MIRDTAAAAVVVRLAGIYGPGRTRLIDRVRAGEPCSAVYTNRIHHDDCAGLLRHLLRLERPRPRYLGADHEPATQCEVPSPSSNASARRSTSTSICTCSSPTESTPSKTSAPSFTASPHRAARTSATAPYHRDPRHPCPGKVGTVAPRRPDLPSLDLEPADGFEPLLGAAAHSRIAVGPPHRAQGPDSAHRGVQSAGAPPPVSLSSRGSPSMSVPGANPTRATPSNACAAPSPGPRSRTNASRSMNGDRSPTDSCAPSTTRRPMSSSVLAPKSTGHTQARFCEC